MMTEQFAVTGMTCAACSAHVEKAVSRLSGVQSAPVNLMLGSMTVTYDDPRPESDIPKGWCIKKHKSPSHFFFSFSSFLSLIPP